MKKWMALVLSVIVLVGCLAMPAAAAGQSKVKQICSYSGDSLVERHSYTYDSKGRVSKLEIWNDEGLVNTVVTYTYDTNGNVKLAEKTPDGEGTTLQYFSNGYDSQKRLTSRYIEIRYEPAAGEVYRGSSVLSKEYITYKYNSKGQLTAKESQLLETNYTTNTRVEYTHGELWAQASTTTEMIKTTYVSGKTKNEVIWQDTYSNYSRTWSNSPLTLTSTEDGEMSLRYSDLPYANIHSGGGCVYLDQKNRPTKVETISTWNSYVTITYR